MYGARYRNKKVILDKDILELIKEQSIKQGISLDDYFNDILKEHIKELSDK